MSAPRWDVEGRDWPNRAHSRFVTAGGLRWHVQVLGDGPTLLLLHGTGAATHSWRTLTPLLAQHFTVIAPDLPGHGFTTGGSPGRLTMAGVAEGLGELLRSMAAAPSGIVGHSAGAAIAVRMTLDGIVQPRAIIGLDAALIPFPGLAARLFPALARALFINPLAPHVFARMARVPGETERFLIRSTGSRIDAEGVRCYARVLGTSGHCAGAVRMMAGWDLDALRRDLSRLTAPLRLIHGDSDNAIPIATARTAAGMVADGQLVALRGLGHLAHEEAPAEVAALIHNYMEGR